MVSIPAFEAESERFNNESWAGGTSWEKPSVEKSKNMMNHAISIFNNVSIKSEVLLFLITTGLVLIRNGIFFAGLSGSLKSNQAAISKKKKHQSN